MKKLMLSLSLLLAALSLSAQAPEQLPIDPQVRYGKLDNGLTYYIRHNEQPKQRCDFHIAQAVGAVLEEDNQNGLAHFLEHMAFNGTEHFPGKLIINYFESIGVNFGGNINAYTSIDETVYRLSDVPTIRESIIDSALLVMHDWASAISLLGEEIDAERGVIREEWRTGATAQRRLWKKMNALMYPGTQYGKRDVIGDTAVINNFSYDALRAYYKKWYGPDNQAVVVVGDIDVDQIEAKIKALWADVPERANRGERPLYTVPLNDQPRVCIATDPEAQNAMIRLIYLHDQMPAELKTTNVAYIRMICSQLISQMFNNRVDELKMDPNASFLYDYARFNEEVKLKDAFMALTIPKEGREVQAYRDLLIQVEKMHRYGFTSDELERAKAEYLNNTETAYNGRNTRQNISIAQECIRHFEDGEPMPGIEWELEFVKQILPLLDLATINELAKIFVHDNPTIAIQGADKEGVNLPDSAVALAILQEVRKMEIEAPKEQAINTTLVKRAPRAARICSKVYNRDIDVTEWTLSNGIKVVFKPTNFKDNQILFQAASLGGESLVKTKDLPSAQLATSAVDFMGLGSFSMNDLQKALTGKTVGVSASINANTEAIEGSCAPRDLETMLQLVYLQFTSPRTDKAAFATMMSVLENQLRNRDTNHKAIFSDSIQTFSTSHSERTILTNMDMLARVDMKTALRVYRERFRNPGDFVFTFVGEIDPEDPEVQSLICTWLGGLKTSSRHESFCDHNVRAPQGIQRNQFERDMQIRTASNRIQYTSYDIPYSLVNQVNMQMIGRILSTRYLESIREREGGSYGVGCYGTIRKFPVPQALLLMQFDTDPEKQAKLLSIIHEEVMTIVNDGPLASDLQKEKESMLKDLQEHLEQNEWWQNCLYGYYISGENTYADLRAAIESISAESVQAMLRRLVDAGNMFEVIMMPKAE